MKYIYLAGLLFFFIYEAQSEDKCEKGFLEPLVSREMGRTSAHRNADYENKFNFNSNSISPRKIKSIKRKHTVNKISKIQMSTQIPLLNIRWTTHENLKYLTAEIEKHRVLVKKITPMELQQLATLQTLKEIGVPTLFLGTSKDSKGTLYMIYELIDGAIISIFISTRWTPETKNTQTLQQIEDIKKFFILKGILTENMNIEIFISRDGNVFINHPQDYNFTGRSLKGQSKKQMELYFDKIIKNIKRNTALLNFSISNQLL